MITYSQEIARGYVYDDPQPYSLDDLDYFTRKVVDDVKKTEQTLFGISLGDIVGDNPSTYSLSTRSVCVVYSLKTDLSPGEHSIEVRATDRYGKQHVGSRKYTILE